MRGSVSSKVARRDRIQKDPRLTLDDFTDHEIEIIEAARQWFPGDIAVIGSRARGNWADDSDIDLGVHGYKSTIHRRIVDRLNDLFDIKVDLFKYEHALTHGSVVVV